MKKSKRKSKTRSVEIVKDGDEYVDCPQDLPEFIHVVKKEEPESTDDLIYIDAAFFAQVQDESLELLKSSEEEEKKHTRKQLSLRLAKKCDAKSYAISRKDEGSEAKDKVLSRRRKLRNATHSKKRLNLADDSDSDNIGSKIFKKLKLKERRATLKKKIGKIQLGQSSFGVKILKTAQKCKYCEYLSKNVPNLKRHEQTHTAQKTIPCDVCGKTFAVEQYMKTHRARHFSTARYECDTCHKQFTRLDNMRRHTILHDDFKPYGCELCDFRAHTCDEILLHVDKHPDSIFPCSFCNKRFNHSTYLRNHILSHTEGRANECEICGLSFAREETLTIHMRSHINTRPFPCFVCNRRFSRRHHLEVHSMAHTDERPFACDLCEARFKHIDTLKKHKRKHEFPKEFKCNLCDKRFVTKAGLKSHAFLHTGDKPFKCEKCDKSFIQYKSMLSHRLSHRQEGPFECARCSRAFMTIVAFNKHVEETHKGEPLPELPTINKKRTVVVREIIKRTLVESEKTSHNKPKFKTNQKDSSNHEKDVNFRHSERDVNNIPGDTSKNSYVTIEEPVKERKTVINKLKILEKKDIENKDIPENKPEKISNEKNTPLLNISSEKKVDGISIEPFATVDKNIEIVKTSPGKLPVYKPPKTPAETLTDVARKTSYNTLNPIQDSLNTSFIERPINNNSSDHCADTHLSNQSNNIFNYTNNHSNRSINLNDYSNNLLECSNNLTESSMSHVEPTQYNKLTANFSEQNSTFTEQPLNFNRSAVVNGEQIYNDRRHLNKQSLNFSEQTALTERSLNQVERALSYMEHAPFINERLTAINEKAVSYPERLAYTDRSGIERVEVLNVRLLSELNNRPISTFSDRGVTERPLSNFSDRSSVYSNLNIPQLCVTNERVFPLNDRGIPVRSLNDRLMSSYNDRPTFNFTERYTERPVSESPANYTQNILNYNENRKNTLSNISPLMAHSVSPMQRYYSTDEYRRDSTYNTADVAINYHVGDRTTPTLDERMHILPEHQRYYDHRKYPEFYPKYNVTPPENPDRTRHFEDDPYNMTRNLVNSHLNMGRLDEYINSVQTQLLDPSNETYKKIHSFLNRL